MNINWSWNSCLQRVARHAGGYPHHAQPRGPHDRECRFHGLETSFFSTKYALNALSFTAREELSGSGIVVSVLHPKMTATDFGQNARGETYDSRSGRRGISVDTPEAVAEAIGKLIESEEAEALMQRRQDDLGSLGGSAAISRPQLSHRSMNYALRYPSTALTSRYSSKPNIPCSRPLPDCL